MTKTTKKVAEKESQESKPKTKDNTAEVKKAGSVVRTYTKEQHGERFKEFADTYVETRGKDYEVVTSYKEDKARCKHCGEVL